MLQLYSMTIAQADAACAADRARVCPARLAQIDTLPARGRDQSFAAAVLLSRALQDCAPTLPQPPQPIYGANGKPHLQQVSGHHFSLSHSGNYVVCAIADQPVGVDLERLRACRPGLAHRFFHPTEVEHLEALPNAERVDTVLRLWTLKESFVKCTGDGLHLPFRRFSVLPNGKDRFSVQWEQTAFSLFAVPFPDAAYLLSVCLRDVAAVPPPPPIMLP